MLWIGTKSDGLCKFDKETELFTHYRHKLDDSTSLSYNDIKSICEDSYGGLWVGTDEGLNRMDRHSGKFVRYTKFNSNIKNAIRKIYEDKTGKLWVGTSEGLYRYNRDKNTFDVFLHDTHDTSTISNNYILSILEDAFGRLWIGTLNGLNKYNKETQTFTQYHEDDGLPNGAIYGILEDGNNNLWLSTNKGVSRFNPQNKTFRNYTIKDGLQAEQFHRVAYKNTYGRMFFSGPNGYNAFYPDSIFDIEYLPSVVIVDFKIFNKSIRVGEELDTRIILKKNIINTKEIILSYKDYVFSFRFAALDYTSPKDIKYAYIMEGFEKEWNYTSANRRFATYTNLPHGKYTFRVRATNSDGLWSKDETAIEVIITPPFWKTWWFRVMAFLVIVGSLYLWYKSRINNIKRQKKELEQQVKERTAKLEKSYNNVKQLSEIGNEITASLSLELIINIVYANVNTLMNADIFGIGIYNSETEAIDFENTKEKAETLAFYSFNINDETWLSTWCFKNQKEVLINDFKLEYKKYLPNYSLPKEGEIPESVVYIPLNVKEKQIGVITVQSFNKDAYKDYHIDILRNIGVYTAIALDNTEAYNQIELQAENLKETNVQLEESHEETQLLNEELRSANDQLLSQRVELEKTLNKLKETQSHLIQSEKMASVGILTAGIAHEINNPLNFILGGKTGIVNYINENLEDHSDEIMSYISFIDEGINRASAIVKSLNRFNRSSNKQDEKCNVSLIISNCLTMLDNQLKGRIEIKQDYSKKFYKLLGNEGELHQVFLNVLSNAIQAIIEKGTISISTKLENEKIFIQISDTGYGMNEENIKKVFEPFFTTKDPGKGTGLGMSIAYSIIEKHKGSIKYKSEVGKGTTVTITFPVSDTVNDIKSEI